MNRKTTLVAAAFALLGTTAFAQEATPDTWQNAHLSKTRDQVRAELVQARKDGSIKAVSAGYIEQVKVSRSRAEVQAELAAARASGELAAIDAPVYAFRAQPAQASQQLAQRAQ